MVRIASWKRFLPVVLLLAGTALLLEARGLREILPPHRDLSAFPWHVADWQGTPQSLSPGELDILGPGEFLVRDYRRSPAEPPVNLYIAFFPSQRSGDTIHSPKNCMPGSGWTPTDSSRIALQRADGSAISLNRYVIAKGATRALALYWYQAHGRVTPSEYWAKVYLVTDAIRMNRTDGALVRVVTPIPDDSAEQAAQARTLEFVQRILPVLDDFVPR
jgi:EpsI family protein